MPQKKIVKEIKFDTIIKFKVGYNTMDMHDDMSATLNIQCVLSPTELLMAKSMIKPNAKDFEYELVFRKKG